MKKRTILVTGSAGFVGRNLCVALRRQTGLEVLEFCSQQPLAELERLCLQADIIFHLAGVNRPKLESEFADGNARLTRQLCDYLTHAGSRAPVVFSSSVQAEMENAYGRSKQEAENAMLGYHRQSGAPVCIYRLPNIFGKWSRPNYNTVVATFCHNISRNLPVQIGDRESVLRFAYIDDVIHEFVEIANRSEHEMKRTHYEIQPVYTITLGALYDLIVSFHEDRKKFLLPDLSRPLTKYLYSTFVSFRDLGDLASPVELKTDERGWLFELAKSSTVGQIFVSRTRPGITRGNHYHDSKIEKFCVVQGEGLIRFRHILNDEIIEYPVNDRAIRIVDIPPGYTHSIENVGSTDMLTLFWANEIFDAQHPDTFFLKV